MSGVNNSWLGNPLLTWDSPALQALRQELDAYCVSITALSGACETESAAKILRNLLEEALKRIVSLKTAIRAYESLNPQSTALIVIHPALNQQEATLKALWQRLSAKEAPTGQSSGSESEHFADEGLRTPQDAAADRIPVAALVPTLNAMHRHLFSTFRIQVFEDRDRTRNLSYSQTLQILKSSDDPALRKNVWRASNAWCSQHLMFFTDLLNLTLTVKANTASSTEALQKRAFAEECIEPQTYYALFEALESHKPLIRESISLRAKACGLTRLPAHELLSSLPPVQPASEDFGNYESTLSFISQAYSQLDPDFAQFADDIHRKRWVDARLHSNKAGGTWCENFPVSKEVAIFANFSSGLAGALQLAHPFAVGYLYHLHNHKGQFNPRIPYCILETAGEIGMAQVLRHYEAGGKSHRAVVQWNQLRSLTNKLLWLPMRHELMKALLTERLHSPLTADCINRHVQTRWQNWFGDTVQGMDPYYWALKPHFFRTDILYYDWQYTFGFLLGRMIVERLYETAPGKRGSLLQTYLTALSTSAIENASQTIFGWDLRLPSFWDSALVLSLKPLRTFRDCQLPRS